MNSIIEHLSGGVLEVTGRLVDASNATLYANCTFDSSTIPVIYKPVAGERPLWDFQDGNLAQREFAAYVISELGNFGVVPPTVLRDGPFGIGMVQQWIHINEEIDLAEFYRQDNPELRKMALFDAVVNNTDRKIGHLLPINEDLVHGCDHGVTFHEEDKLRTVLWQWADKALTDEEMKRLVQLEKSVQESSMQLRELISEGEYSALLARINRLLVEKKYPTPSDEWPAVPWPPF
ncbi:SCO1664 family protein [Actinobacteria bacterium IMCC25003]|nr:SCO1664 family protein [Actinobacteria bacterium IMCC25003]